jgi:hypothetical protein
MSRCCLDDEKRYEVAIGWDPPMKTFFAQVLDNNIKGEDDERMIFWSGGGDRRIYKDPDELIQKIQPYACKHDPELLRRELLKDKKTDRRTTLFFRRIRVARMSSSSSTNSGPPGPVY